jgi:flavodoxin
MKVIVVFDTIYGNTRRIAEAIVEGLGSKHESELVRAEEANRQTVENIDVLMVGSPTHGGWYSASLKEFFDLLSEESLQGIRVCSFDTSTPMKNQGFVVNRLTRLFGRAAPRIARELKKKGATIVDTKTFIVLGRKGPLEEGELEHACEWAAAIMSKITEDR